MSTRPSIEAVLEGGIFRSRWLLAPFYVGLVFALVMLLASFCREIYDCVPKFFAMSAEEVILSVLTMIDLSLAGNLVIIIIFSGYENFVSKIDTKDSEDRPSWMGTLDFSGLKMKVIGSIVAISIISLLRAFMILTQPGAQIDASHLLWLLVLHLSFLASGVMFALMDWIACKTEEHSRRQHFHGPVSP